MKALCNVTVLENGQIGPCLHLARFSVDGAGAAQLGSVHAGMFVMLRCDEGDALSFRRPFSFSDVDPLNNTFDLYYRVLGDQTKKLAQAGEGTSLSAILPLGNSFTMASDDAEQILVAGGIGVAPLLMYAREIKRAGRPSPRFYFGARNKAELCFDYLNTVSADFRLSTDDGSHGYKGTVVEQLIKDGIAPGACIYACGPPAMLKSLKSILPDDTPAEASLEEVMACGIGACYGCAVQTDGSGAEENKLVCRDGPVFPLRSIRFG